MALGRPCIWGDKSNGQRVQAVLTEIGGQEFEWTREELAALYQEVMGRKPTAISDADVIEYRLRGREAARTALAALKVASQT